MKNDTNDNVSQALERLHLSEAWLNAQQRAFQWAISDGSLTESLSELISVILEETHG